MFLVASPGRSLPTQPSTLWLMLRKLWTIWSEKSWSQASRLTQWGSLTLPAIGYS